ncbi:MAG: MmcQ/YjbR family DNA-binding protein [Hyphomonadaceae bacterium]
MTPAAYLKLAMAMPGSQASSHHGSSDIRVGGKIFTTPADRDGGYAILKLTGEQQAMMCKAEPDLFSPVPGGWGRKGWTRFLVDRADAATAKSALWTAWRNVAPKRLQAEQSQP